jgi:CIC family chloride channel protein
MKVPVLARIRSRFQSLAKDQQLLLSALALVVGIVAAFGAVVFREMISFVQAGAFGSPTEHLASLAASLPSWHLVLAPALAGLVVGLFVQFALRDRRPLSVPEVIEASAIHGGRMTLRDGLFSALVSAISIGGGASVGREGPAIHLGSALASACGGAFKLNRSQSRIIIGAGAASAIAASFNAPFAGVFFAHEVIIGHYALPAFAPVAIASITGTVISRIYFGDFPAFIISRHEITSYLEMPAFALLGVVCALAAVTFIRLVPLVQDLHTRLKIPCWGSPVIGGVLVGVMALWFPEVLGVGYEATDKALKGEYLLTALVALAVAKLLASAICLGSGFGGGVVSPSLFVGAMVGGAFGALAAVPFPELASSLGAYAITGMGAMAAAVLGAPVSTTLMIFELTGDYQLTVAVLIAVVIAMIFVRVLHGPSYFLHMLRRRGLELRGGHDVGALVTIVAADLMRDDHVVMASSEGLPALRENLLSAPHGEVFVEDDRGFVGRLMLSDVGPSAYDTSGDGDVTVGDFVVAKELYVYRNDPLQTIVEIFASTEDSLLAVLNSEDDRHVVGCLHERDAIRAEAAYAKALERLRDEEH